MSWAPVSTRARVCIALLWAAFLPCSFWAYKFTQSLSLNIDPPHGTASFAALQAYKRAFPLQAVAPESSYAVLLEMSDGSPVIDGSSPICEQHLGPFPIREPRRCPLRPEAAAFSRGFEEWLSSPANSTVPAGWVNATTFLSYHSYHERNFSLLQSSLLSDAVSPTKSTATLLIFQARPPPLDLRPISDRSPRDLARPHLLPLAH